MMDRTLAIRPTPNLLLTKWLSSVMANDPRAEEYKQQAAAQVPPDQLLQGSAQVAMWSGQLAEFGRLLSEGRAQLSAAGQTEALAQITQWEVTTRAALERGPALERMKTLARTASTPTASRLLYAAILAAIGDIDTARPIARSLEGQANDPQTRNLMTAIRAYSLAADGQTAEAVATLEEILRESPQAVDVHVHIGSIKRAAGDLEGAAAAFQKTLDGRFQLGADVPVIMAKYLLAEVRLEQGRREDARVLIDEMLAQWAAADTEFWMLERVREMGGTIS
jgi:tetratricopeptide (TPR) repeat protein